jgi:hypothetical protein
MGNVCWSWVDTRLASDEAEHPRRDYFIRRPHTSRMSEKAKLRGDAEPVRVRASMCHELLVCRGERVEFLEFTQTGRQR